MKDVPYLSTRLGGCSVGPGISRDARKLARTPWVIKKNDTSSSCLIFNQFRLIKHIEKSGFLLLD